MTPTLAAVIAYMLVQLAIGVWASRRIASEDDYLVAGRRLGYPLMTFSIFATWFGAETIVGSAGTTYDEGVSLGSAEPFGYGLCLIVMGLVFAVPLHRRKLTTLADLYRQRYSVGVERFAALILIPGSLLWAAAQVRAFGSVLTTTTSAIELETAIAIAAGVTLLYTTFGGLLSDAITDLVQGVLLIVGLFVVAGGVVAELGGIGAAADAVATSGRVHLTSAGSGSALDAVEAWAIPVFGSLITTEIVGRVVAARSPTVARRSSLAAGTLYIAIGIIPVLLGIVGPGLVPELEDAEQIIPTLAIQSLSTVGYALFAGGLISAILSTVDSTLLVSAGLLSHNLIVPVLKVVDERRKVRLARWGVIVFGVIAYLLARRAEGVFALVEQASAFGSAGVIVTVAFGLFTRLGGPATAMATLVVGTVTYLIATYAGFAYPFMLSLVLALATYVVGSLLERSRR
ncbi:MAG TPA: sodium:solute symporter family protein [Gemmatimonadaceae bacterium]|nr:sodium:solute symporter family protein [Gemmatimonadaceae bacterium]